MKSLVGIKLVDVASAILIRTDVGNNLHVENIFFAPIIFGFQALIKNNL